MPCPGVGVQLLAIMVTAREHALRLPYLFFLKDVIIMYFCMKSHTFLMLIYTNLENILVV